MREITISTAENEDYLKELEAFLVDPSTKRCVLLAHAKAITRLVNIALEFKNKHSKVINIDDISIGTVRGLSMKKETTKNVSFMKIVLVKRETLKE
nr:hypothetical protein [Candidatus Sigynarchaeota archaeon]